MQKEKTIDIYLNEGEGFVLQLRTKSQEEADRKLEELKAAGAQPTSHTIEETWKIYEQWFLYNF